MPDRDPGPKSDEQTVLSPYFPAESPSIPGSGRTWFAILSTMILLLGAVYGLLALLLGL